VAEHPPSKTWIPFPTTNLAMEAGHTQRIYVLNESALEVMEVSELPVVVDGGPFGEAGDMKHGEAEDDTREEGEHNKDHGVHQASASTCLEMRGEQGLRRGSKHDEHCGECYGEDYGKSTSRAEEHHYSDLGVTRKEDMIGSGLAPGERSIRPFDPSQAPTVGMALLG